MKKISTTNKYYPKRLLEIKDHPKELYTEGDISILNNNIIAIVGSRDCSDYGKKQTERFASYLSEKGITIISGLARGIDTIAHTYSMQKLGKTLAVIASGFNHIFPLENKELFKQILENGGCIISEYEPDIDVDMQRFPKRNRIISGIAQGVLVIESKYRSGSNITARDAIRQKKEVFCIPGNINSKTSYGTNLLIQQGAKLVISPVDLIEMLEYENIESKDNNDIQEEYKKVYQNIGTIPVSIYEIAKKSEMSISETSEKLIMLELQGKIKNIFGNKYLTI